MPTTMRSHQGIIIITLCFSLLACTTPFQKLTPKMIRSDLEGVRQLYFVPSLGVAEISVDTISIFGPVGTTEGDNDHPVTSTSLYQLGSCTKAMTATALEKLLTETTLSWDTKLLDVFPEFATTANSAYREVTLNDIVSHQAGLPPAGDPHTWEMLRKYKGSKAQYVDKILQKPSWIRRGRYLYSNSGYAALGAIIEKQTGLSYTDAMDKLVFQPLGIKAYYGFPKDIGPEQPWGNTANWSVAAKARAIDQNIPEVLAPAGIVSMTLPDFARFVQLHLRGMLDQDDAGFTTSMISQLHQTRVDTRGPFKQAYAAGWLVEEVNDETIHWHNGSAGNFYVVMAINPSRKKGVAIVTNVGPELGHRVSWDIVERMLTGEAS
jgi:D-alanyl-D-alanine carboxypeptidase